MLTNEEKNRLIDNRLRDYDIKIYNMEIDICALLAIDKEEESVAANKRMETLKKARAEVEAMKVTADADTE